MRETAYDRPAPAGQRLEHGYGDHVHVLADAWALSMAARIGHPDTQPPMLIDLVESAYKRMLASVAEQFPLRRLKVETRMTSRQGGVCYEGSVIDPDHKVVIVDITRAGIVPSLCLQRALLEFLPPTSVRVDHVYVQRIADPVTGHVAGVDMSGSKIGGSIDGATLIIPDPMGATGTSILNVLDMYRRDVPGTPARIVTCHLFVTPEYLRNLTEHAPHVNVYAMRVDRGMSAPDVLETRLGTRWAEERGLNDHDYIVPGAGGMGEVLNNAFV